MRIVGGQFRGRRIMAPKGDVTRPTADRTRESLFNILTNLDGFEFDGARAIDLFAGSGALGFEALSHGGAFCLFVETDARSRGAIRDNIETLGLFGQTRLHRRSATNLGPRPANLGEAFNLAFLDPPYGKDLATPALIELASGGWLSPGAIIVVEQGKNEAPVIASRFAGLDQRAYGAAQISLFRYHADTEN